MANRYRELLDLVPSGRYYDVEGEVLPLRGEGQPHELYYSTGDANRDYDVFVNGVFDQRVTTNASGVVALQLSIEEAGQVELQLIDRTTQRIFRAYFRVDLLGTLYAGAAAVFSFIDDRVTQLRNALSISTANSQFLGEVYGRLLNQPADINYLLGAYRNTLQELRQAYRLWGARTAGLRRVVSALTSSSPLIVPRQWQPRWVLDHQILPNNDFARRGTLADSSLGTALVNLNARSATYVKSAFSGATSPVAGIFTSPPSPQELSVTFDATYVASAAGNITLTGLDAAGDVVSDVFVKPAAAGRVRGSNQQVFASISSASFPVGSGTASIGLWDAFFVEIVELNGRHLPGGGSGSVVLHYLSSPDRLRLGTNGLPVAIETSGRFTVAGELGRGAVVLEGAAYETGAGFAYGANLNRVYVQVDDLGVVPVDLPASPAAATAVRDAINARVQREVSYGGSIAFGTITVLDTALINDAEIITLGDGLGNTLVLEADNDDAVTATRVAFAFDSLTTAQCAQNIRDRINQSGVDLFALIDPTADSVVRISGAFSGTLSNVTITTTIAAGGLVPTGLAGGSNAAGDLAAVCSTRANSNFTATALALSAQSSSYGADAMAEVRAGLADAGPTVFGLTKAQTTLNGAVAAADRDVVGADTSSLPVLPVLRIHVPVASSVINAPGPFAAPDFNTPVEAHFSPEWDGGNILVTGTDCTGQTVQETLTHPGKSVTDTGSANTSVRGGSSRSAASLGTLASATVIGAGLPAARDELIIYNLTALGAAGNAWTVSVVLPTNNAAPFAQVVGTDLEIHLATVASAPSPAGANDSPDIVAAINRDVGEQFFAVVSSDNAGEIDGTVTPFSFSGGVDGGQIVELADNQGLAGHSFDAAVKPGMIFRCTSGTYAGVERVIEHVGAGARAFPPNSSKVGQRIVYLRSSVGGSFLNESWEILQTVVVQGQVVFKTVTSANNSSAGTEGSYELYIADALTRFAIPVRVGRGLKDSGTGDADVDVLLGAVPDRATLSIASLTVRPDLLQGALRISGGAAFVGSNNGFHSIAQLDPYLMDGTDLTITHEGRHRARQFVQAPTGGTDYSTLIDETGLDWEVFIWGETALMIENDRGTDTITLAYPGLIVEKPTGNLLEVLEEADAVQRGLQEGLDTVTVDVDRTLLPTAAASDSVAIQNNLQPDGWRLFNVSTANSVYGVFGDTQYARLLLEGSGAGTPILERDVPNAVQLKGFDLRISFWVQQNLTAAAVNFRIDVAFDGITYTAGTNVGVTGTPITSSVTLVESPACPSLIQRTVRVPYDVSDMRVRLIYDDATAGARIILDNAFIEAVHATGLFVGENTLALTEKQQAYGELLYAWSSSAMTAAEDRGAGLPADTNIGGALPAKPGHIDLVSNAHGYWERVDVSEYNASAPVNLIGVYTELEWLAATLTALEVVVETPAKHSYVKPSAVSLVSGEVLSVTAPSDASLAVTSRHEGLFPQAGEGSDRLYKDGVPVPSTGYPGTRASATIGASSSSPLTITITAVASGTVGNAFTITIDAGVGTDRKLSAAQSAAGAVTVNLAVSGGALNTDQNRALFVAQVIDALEGVNAVVAAGDEALAVDAAEGPTAFTGATSDPWRFTAAGTVQIASVAAGDAADQASFDPPSNTLPIYAGTSVYTLDYERLMRAESAVLDLGASYTDYLWLVDYTLFLRNTVEQGEASVTNALVFRGDYRAVLSDPSTRDKTTSRLFKDDGVVRTEIPVSDWSFIDASTIEMVPGQFDAQAIYALEYQRIYPRFSFVASVVIEVRSASTSVGVATADWREAAQDEVVDQGHRYHQIRATVRNVTDVRDIRIKGMGLKGINLYATTPNAPGIITCDD